MKITVAVVWSLFLFSLNGAVAGDDLKDLLREVEGELAELRGQRGAYRFSNSTGAEEGEAVLKKALKDTPSLLAKADQVELVRVFEAAKKPMSQRGGEAKTLPGAFSEKALVGTSPAIMMWGPYVELEPGRHLVVYRVKFLNEVKGKHVCFVDVCHDAVTFSGRRPGAEEVPAGEWHAIAIPVDAPKKMKFEFRLWPQNNQVAVDRIYVYKLGQSKGQEAVDGVSVMGAVGRTGTYAKRAREQSVSRLVDAARGGNGLAAKERFTLWRRDDDVIRKVDLDPGASREKTEVRAGDIIWIPEG